MLGLRGREQTGQVETPLGVRPPLEIRIHCQKSPPSFGKTRIRASVTNFPSS